MNKSTTLKRNGHLRKEKNKRGLRGGKKEKFAARKNNHKCYSPKFGSNKSGGLLQPVQDSFMII